MMNRIRCLKCNKHFDNPTPYELMEHSKNCKKRKAGGSQ